jgi:hypothetical protein
MLETTVAAVYRSFFGLCAVLSATAGAQQPATPDWNDKSALAVGTKTYSCVDPADAMARRWLQDEPCKLPRYHLPAAGTPDFDERPSWPTYPPKSPATEGAHAMFWRFPVQPMGPHEVPRHTWR